MVAFSKVLNVELLRYGKNQLSTVDLAWPNLLAVCPELFKLSSAELAEEVDWATRSTFLREALLVRVKQICPGHSGALYEAVVNQILRSENLCLWLDSKGRDTAEKLFPKIKDTRRINSAYALLVVSKDRKDAASEYLENWDEFLQMVLDILTKKDITKGRFVMLGKAGGNFTIVDPPKPTVRKGQGSSSARRIIKRKPVPKFADETPRAAALARRRSSTRALPLPTPSSGPLTRSRTSGADEALPISQSTEQALCGAAAAVKRKRKTSAVDDEPSTPPSKRTRTAAGRAERRGTSSSAYAEDDAQPTPPSTRIKRSLDRMGAAAQRRRRVPAAAYDEKSEEDEADLVALPVKRVRTTKTAARAQTMATRKGISETTNKQPALTSERTGGPPGRRMSSVKKIAPSVSQTSLTRRKSATH